MKSLSRQLPEERYELMGRMQDKLCGSQPLVLHRFQRFDPKHADEA